MTKKRDHLQHDLQMLRNPEHWDLLFVQGYFKFSNVINPETERLRHTATYPGQSLADTFFDTDGCFHRRKLQNAA